MKMRYLGAIVCGALVPAAAAGAAGEQTAVNMLFNTKHLETLEKGHEVTYRFDRKVSDVRLGGEAFTDDIKIGIKTTADNGSKDVELRVFTGARARHPFDTPNMTGNPILLWYLDRAVATYRLFAGGSEPYLKGRFRDAIGDNAEVTVTKITYNGSEIDGHKITLSPYKNDPAASRMQGFEKSRFELIVSDQIPGYFYDMVATYESSIEGTPKVEERITLMGAGERQ